MADRNYYKNLDELIGMKCSVLFNEDEFEKTRTFTDENCIDCTIIGYEIESEHPFGTLSITLKLEPKWEDITNDSCDMINDMELQSCGVNISDIHNLSH
jgi:hypothetical protein